MDKYNVWILEKNYEMPIDQLPIREWIKEKINGKVFETVKQLDILTMVLSKTPEAYIKGLGCPADAKRALKVIDNLKTYKIGA